MNGNGEGFGKVRKRRFPNEVVKLFPSEGGLVWFHGGETATQREQRRTDFSLNPPLAEQPNSRSKGRLKQRVAACEADQEWRLTDGLPEVAGRCRSTSCEA